jgi:hypothetical protein
MKSQDTAGMLENVRDICLALPEAVKKLKQPAMEKPYLP